MHWPQASAAKKHCTAGEGEEGQHEWRTGAVSAIVWETYEELRLYQKRDREVLEEGVATEEGATDDPDLRCVGLGARQHGAGQRLPVDGRPTSRGPRGREAGEGGERTKSMWLDRPAVSLRWYDLISCGISCA